MRVRRAYEFTCRCGRYPFPHRMFGGKCKGQAWVEDFNEDHAHGECTRCACYDGNCQVVTGQESVREAPCLAEFVQYEGLHVPVSWRGKGYRRHHG